MPIPNTKNTEVIPMYSSKLNIINKPKWFVFYTYSKSELKVQKMLHERGYETYLPCVIQTRQWHDRKKKIRVPLFPNYIFVRTTIEKIYSITDLNLICSFVKFKNNAAIINEEEIHRIKTMLEYSNDINVSNEFQCGNKVEILNGPLAGLCGIIIKKNSDTKFVIYLKELAQYVSISIDLTNLNICKRS